MAKKTGASEEALGSIHDKYTRVLEYLLDNAAYREQDDGADGTEIFVNKAVLDAVARHVKDNNVTCVANEDNALSQLQKTAAKGAAKKRFGALIQMPGLTKEEATG